jgi:uncharacterized membrane protein YhhN
MLPAAVQPWVLLTLVALGLHLLAESQRSATWGPIALAVTKLAASSGFLMVAVSAGALDHDWGRWLFAGLALSFIGDACLLGHGKPLFLAGLVAFLLGHVSYCVAFVVHGYVGSSVLVLAPVVLLAAWLVDRWLGERVEPDMRLPVRAYIVVISTMLCLAFGAWRAGASPLLLLGAVSFYLSDLAVARDRFVQQDFFNRLWGLPAYYLGQLCLAMSVVAQ